MKPETFEFYQPKSVADALELLRKFGEDARVISGGQSLVPMMNLRLATPKVLIDLNDIPQLTGVNRNGDRLTIGAMTRQQSLLQDSIINADLPLLAKALAHVGHYQTRSRGTIGGSLAHADPSAEISLVAATLEAELTILNATGSRTVSAKDFFVDAMTTTLTTGDLLASVAFPAKAGERKTAFRELSKRHGDFAIAAAAAQWSPSTRELQIGVGSICATPIKLQKLSAAARAGEGFSRLEALVKAELDALDIIVDVHTSVEYRRHLGAICAVDCLREVLQ